jgi:predicted HAD superfamily phosphohydrolase
MEDNGPPRTEGVRRDPSIFAIEEDIFAMDGDKSTTVWIISFSVLIGVLDEHVQNKRRRTNKDEVQQLVRPLQSKISKGVVAGSIHRMKTRTSALSTEIQRVQEAMTNMQAERADMLKSFEQWAAEKEKELVQQSNQLVERKVEQIKQDMLQQMEHDRAAERSRVTEMGQDLQRMKDSLVRVVEHITCMHLISL